jgi:hypothetical protein
MQLPQIGECREDLKYRSQAVVGLAVHTDIREAGVQNILRIRLMCVASVLCLPVHQFLTFL